jgi:hypothetical protein
MTIKQMLTTGVAALALVGAAAPAASAVAPPQGGLSDVLSQVGDTLGTNDDGSRLHSLVPPAPVSTDLTSRVGDGLHAMATQLLR